VNFFTLNREEKDVQSILLDNRKSSILYAYIYASASY
jgi:hypothetical protein